MKTTIIFLGIVFILTFLAFKNDSKTIKPGEIWPDNKGVHINAHGGGILFHKGKYYCLVNIKLKVGAEMQPG